jgi:hypothetical protein
MAKDYFEDIVPPQNSSETRVEKNTGPATSLPIRTNADSDHGVTQVPKGLDSYEPEEPERTADAAPAERSIRNISAPRSRIRPARDMREAPAIGMSGPAFAGDSGGKKTKWWLWVIAAVCVAALAILLFVSLRPTVITLAPRSHAVTFDSSYLFTAYPSDAAATGTLPYTVQISDIEDSQVVASEGTVHAEDKASGSITVYNGYQTAPLKLIKNTRFETPDGFIFRVPAEIVVPGKQGATPGQVTVTVFADQPGAQYNVAPTSFTVPGLKGSAMYSSVSAKSTEAMTGGFVGDKPGVAPAALQSAVAEVRARLETKARESVVSTATYTIFPELVRITYQDLPNTIEAGGGVRIHQKAHVEAPVFDAKLLAAVVSQTVSADAGDASVTLVPGSGFSVAGTGDSVALGTDSVQFTMSGTAQIVWDIDSTALVQALLGRSQDAFETIVATFPSIQEAHAKIEPFWSGSFPEDESKIKVEIQAVEAK